MNAREEPFAGMQPLSQAPLTASKIAYDSPVYTSTPTENRLETQQDRINMQPAFEIIKRLNRIESELTMLYQIVSNRFKSEIKLLFFFKPDQTHAAAVQSSSQTSDGLIFQQGGRNGSQSCADSVMQINSNNETNHNQPRSDL